MSTATDAPVIRYDITDAAIRKMGEELSEVTVEEHGYDAVRKAIAAVRDTRVSVEKTRKALKADALKWGKAVDTEAKRITAMLSAIEEPLRKRKQDVDDAKARKKREKEEAERKAAEAERDRIQAEAMAEVERAKAAAEQEIKAKEMQLAMEREALEKREAELAEREAALLPVEEVKPKRLVAMPNAPGFDVKEDAPPASADDKPGLDAYSAALEVDEKKLHKYLVALMGVLPPLLETEVAKEVLKEFSREFAQLQSETSEKVRAMLTDEGDA